MDNVLQLRPASAQPEKRRIPIGMFLDSFDEMTDLLLTPGLPDDLCREFINNWRKVYGLPARTGSSGEGIGGV